MPNLKLLTLKLDVSAFEISIQGHYDEICLVANAIVTVICDGMNQTNNIAAAQTTSTIPGISHQYNQYPRSKTRSEKS